MIKLILINVENIEVSSMFVHNDSRLIYTDTDTHAHTHTHTVRDWQLVSIIAI